VGRPTHERTDQTRTTTLAGAPLPRQAARSDVPSLTFGSASTPVAVFFLLRFWSRKRGRIDGPSSRAQMESPCGRHCAPGTCTRFGARAAGWNNWRDRRLHRRRCRLDRAEAAISRVPDTPRPCLARRGDLPKSILADLAMSSPIRRPPCDGMSGRAAISPSIT
jgi:hypothetical protein